MFSEPILYNAGLAIFIVVGLYFLFLAADGLGLQARKDSGTVVGREHREAVMGHRTEIVNYRPLVVPHVTPEKYVLKLDINGRQGEGIVSRSFFEMVQPGDKVQVTFQKRRLTGLLRVLDVTRADQPDSSGG
jgi:hypothetical protein